MFISYIIPFFIAAGAVWMGRRKWSDQDKIEKVLEMAEVKEGDRVEKFKLLRKDPINGDRDLGVEYVYKIPLKSSMDKIEAIYPSLRDGINIKREGQQKHVEIEYDGALRIRVFEQGMKNEVPYSLLSVKGWCVSLGLSYQGEVLHDFSKIPHMLISGTTRYGKTVFLKNVITTLIVTQPELASFTLIDLKGGLAFNRYKNLRQVKETANDVAETYLALKNVLTSMTERIDEFREKGYENLEESPYEDRHFIIIDEGADMSSHRITNVKLKKVHVACESMICEIARKGGGVGYHLLFATQYPLRENLPPDVKINCDAKLVFRLQNGKASETVMNETGAEKLPRKKGSYQGGRAIYMTDAPLIVQTPFITNDTIEKLIEPYKVVKTDEHSPEGAGEEGADFVEFGNIRLPVNKPDPETPLTWKLP